MIFEEGREGNYLDRDDHGKGDVPYNLMKCIFTVLHMTICISGTIFQVLSFSFYLGKAGS